MVHRVVWSGFSLLACIENTTGTWETWLTKLVLGEKEEITGVLLLYMVTFCFGDRPVKVLTFLLASTASTLQPAWMVCKPVLSMILSQDGTSWSSTTQ